VRAVCELIYFLKNQKLKCSFDENVQLKIIKCVSWEKKKETKTDIYLRGERRRRKRDVDYYTKYLKSLISHRRERFRELRSVRKQLFYVDFLIYDCQTQKKLTCSSGGWFLYLHVFFKFYSSVLFHNSSIPGVGGGGVVKGLHNL
jgi:hypothetical protein